MKTIFIEDIIKKIGEQVDLFGWVYTIRDHKHVVFIDIRDRTGIVQVVSGQEFRGLSPEDVVHIRGIVKKRPDHLVNPKLGTGNIEIEAQKINVLSKAQTLPFDFSKESLDVSLPTLLNYRALTLRHPKIKAIFEVQEVVIDSFRTGLKEKGFIEFQSPVIIPQTAEGGADVFEVSYFRHKAYLSQSPQFYKQIMVPVFEKVFTVNKTLRAEPSVTTRHLTEVTTLDAEMGFIDSWEELMDSAEYILRYIFSVVRKQCGANLDLYEYKHPLLSKKLPRIKLRDAQHIIHKQTGRNVEKEPDLSPDDEKEICEWARKEHDAEFVFVTHFPVEKRPFYTLEDPKDPGYTLSFDLIGRGLELLTGGQRINDCELLIQKAKERDIDLSKSELYLQAFRYGMPPEGGYSFGSERIVMILLGLANIRQAAAFPRDMERIDVHLPSVLHDQQNNTS